MMGYCIDLEGAKFKIKRENVPWALTALKKLGTGANDLRAHGGSSGPGINTSWFSWMNGKDVSSWTSIEKAMADWRYPIGMDAEGNVVDIRFSGEKIGQEDLMFQAIAPYVEAGSYIQMVGEDGAHWQYQFDGTKMLTKRGEISF